MPARVSRRSGGRAAAIPSARFAAEDRREATRHGTAYLHQRPS